jgi:hypothetical protein
MDVWHQVGQKAKVWGMDKYHQKEHFLEFQRIVSKSNPIDQRTMDFHKICETAGPDFDLKAMIAWYKRPWFSRVWVVQEFCLGRRTVFVCGEKRVAVDLVLLARQIFDFYLPYALTKGMLLDERRDAETLIDQNPTASLFAARNRRRRFECSDGTKNDETSVDRKSNVGIGDELFQLLQRFYVYNNLQATDPRDRIFGLAALATDMKKLGIETDYTTSTIDQIYTRTARAIIHDGKLDLLRLAQFPKTLESLPSWVPDWCGNIQPSFCSLGPSNPTSTPPLFAASGSDQPFLIPTGDDSRLLGVRGYLVDEVEQVCCPWTYPSHGGNPDHVPYLAFLSDIKSLCMISAARNSDIYETSQRQAEGIWRIPIGDVEEMHYSDMCRATSSFFKGYRKFFHDCEADELVKTISSSAEARALFAQWEGDEAIASLYRSRMNEMRNKRPYLSKNGYVGMGPVTTIPGDVIVVLIGAQIPYVLRPEGQGRFTFLGEAYCDGIMDGEIRTRKTKQDFVIL